MATSTIFSNPGSGRKACDGEHLLLVAVLIACGLIPFVATSFSILYETVLDMSAPHVSRFDQQEAGRHNSAPVTNSQPPEAASGSGKVQPVSAEMYLIESLFSEY
jgi:hypothetical protein